MAKTKTAHARYIDGMRFEIDSGSGHTLTVDTPGDEGGENAGFSPMELPLMALVGCMGMDVVSILRKSRQDLRGYQMNITGTRAETHPKVFVEIQVEHVFAGTNLSQDTIDRAINLSATKYCSVSAMLEKTAQITHTTRIVAPEDLPAESEGVAGP
jgi:putative redox protein